MCWHACVGGRTTFKSSKKVLNIAYIIDCGRPKPLYISNQYICKRRGRKKTKRPTCRQLLSPKKRCSACRNKRNASACIMRQTASVPEPDDAPQRKRLRKQTRRFRSEFVTAKELNKLDRYLNETEPSVPWMSKSCGKKRTRGSERLTLIKVCSIYVLSCTQN